MQYNTQNSNQKTFPRLADRIDSILIILNHFLFSSDTTS